MLGGRPRRTGAGTAEAVSPLLLPMDGDDIY